ncbi:unnamed protein product [Clonostachys rhizophaga]|uniref:FYVE-type domain-containing protein n=1 Tax=Clonostachys rhizophaga TaxID=160324 RepID=A0A9N9VNX7_9HYPO|nr:unnamed protein product [Clonostachys rhizophaga]
MAAELIMPTLPGDQHPHHHHHFATQRPPHSRSLSFQVPQPHSNQLSPLSTSDLDKHHASTPSSPKAKHARPARPMYMPAVLRPNSDFICQKITGVSPTNSDASSVQTAGRRRLSGAGFMMMPGFSALGQRLTRRTTGDSTKSFESGWDLDLFPQVTDLPTRKHWKPDPESSVCDDPTCKRTFNYFTRRHHCRRCGNIFCDPHSSFEVPLDQDANFNPRAPPSRTCNHCFEQYRDWHSRNNSQSSSSASSDDQNVAPPTPIAAIPGAAAAALALPKGPEVAASVPRDWNWSTF